MARAGRDSAGGAAWRVRGGAARILWCRNSSRSEKAHLWCQPARRACAAAATRQRAASAPLCAECCVLSACVRMLAASRATAAPWRGAPPPRQRPLPRRLAPLRRRRAACAAPAGAPPRAPARRAPRPPQRRLLP
jgi:hypothetical protein